MASSNNQPSMKEIASQILRDTMKNIVHETILQKHHQHKMLLANLDPSTRLLHCKTCRLPRLIEPPLAPQARGVATDPPSDTVYCDKKPWCRKPGHDIYGNPFPKSDVTGRPPTKKEREAAAAKNKKDNNNEGTPASNEGGDGGNGGANDGTAPPSPSDAGTNKGEKLEKGEKKASKIDEKLKKGEYVPWQTCPSCKRSLLITRFAKHLEQCMGLSGRAASRNAMAKMNGSTTGANTTPVGSRGGTPGPGGSQEPGEEEDEDERIKGPGGVRKKVLKKGLSSKIRKDKFGAGISTPTTTILTANGKPPKNLTSSSKRPPQPAPGSSPPPPSAAGDSKRDRDEMLGDEDEEEEEEEVVHVKKRQKLQRVESAVSLASTAATGMGTAGMEREESQDGSFVDDGGSFGED